MRHQHLDVPGEVAAEVGHRAMGVFGELRRPVPDLLSHRLEPSSFGRMANRRNLVGQAQLAQKTPAVEDEGSRVRNGIVGVELARGQASLLLFRLDQPDERRPLYFLELIRCLGSGHLGFLLLAFGKQHPRRQCIGQFPQGAGLGIEPLAHPGAGGHFAKIQGFPAEPVLPKRLDGFEVTLAQIEQTRYRLEHGQGSRALRNWRFGIKGRVFLDYQPLPKSHITEELGKDEAESSWQTGERR
ncbi:MULTISPECIES: hypothetical protein [Methylococcus]|uniref:Uncharacterized protein n=1 Tax=Methylococcus capsulatus TaxID=414 RepID=A0ABZ2F4D9_METCP|nr:MULTISPECIES: hypothetical protein [Methylococcus]MDF9393191.1 hypothetical protein [Methylococcus capsulatus]